MSSLDRSKTKLIVLICGTDTSVGKTWLGATLAQALVRAQHRVVALKPLETGCGELPTEMEDGVVLARAAKQEEPAHALLRLHAAVAPPEAADRETKQIDFDDLVRRIRAYALGADVVLVEGAGGLYSPLTWEHHAVDLAKVLAARILLVAPDRLGVINHTVMALKLLALNDIDVVGVVLIAPEQADASTGSNAAAIARVSKQSRILEVARGLDEKTIAHRMQQVIEWLDLEALPRS